MRPEAAHVEREGLGEEAHERDALAGPVERVGVVAEGVGVTRAAAAPLLCLLYVVVELSRRCGRRVLGVFL